MSSLIPAHRRTRTDLNALKVRCQREGCCWTGRLDARPGHECLVARIDALKGEVARKDARIAELEGREQQQQVTIQNLERKVEELHRQQQQDKLVLAEMAEEELERSTRLREYLQHGRMHYPRGHPCMPHPFMPTPVPAWRPPMAPHPGAWPGGPGPAPHPMGGPPMPAGLQMMPIPRPGSDGMNTDNNNNGQCPAPVPVMFYYCNIPPVPPQNGSAEEP